MRVDLLSKLPASVDLLNWPLCGPQRLLTGFTGDFCGDLGLLEVIVEVQYAVTQSSCRV